jgi:hypothetical protein
MPVEMLTYAALGQRLNCSPAAARALVKRLRLPRQKANDGKALVSVDLSEINYKPPADHRPVTASLNARIDALQAGLAEVETAAACHRTDFERERERLDELMVELLRATLEGQTAKEAVARLEGQLTALLDMVELLRATLEAQTAKEAVAWLEGQLTALPPRPWWRRLAIRTGIRAALLQAA